MEYKITHRLNNALDELTDEFSDAYCDQDFRWALNELKDSDEANWHENLNRILRMLKKCGCAYQPNGQESYAFYENLIMGLIENDVIVSGDKMSQSILSACEKLYGKYREYPTPTDYMQRLVDHLSPNDWQQDTLRVRILKRFIEYGNYLTAAEIGKRKPIQRYAGIKLGKEKVTDKEVLEQLDDSIYAMIVIPSTEEIERAMQTAASSPLSKSQGQELRELILNTGNTGLPTFFDVKTYQVVTELLLQPNAIKQLTKSILLRYAGETRDMGDATEAEIKSALGEKVCSAVSQSVLDGITRALNKAETRNSVINTMQSRLNEREITVEKLLKHLYSALHKAIRKQNNEDYSLLRISDDLASGQFRTNGATKRNLYLFAIVFHMTYYCSSQPNGVKDPLFDVEQSLFTDYYAANVMQFLSKSYKTGRTDVEIIPSGCSINYKNYAEMIYLYYICQSYDKMPAAEKLKRAAKMIETVKVSGRDAAAPNTLDRQDGATRKMKELVSGRSGQIACEAIMALPEEDFQDFIINHYDRRVHISNSDISPFQVNAQDRTAQAEYTRIVEKLLGSPADPQGDTPLKDYQQSVDFIKIFAKDSYDSVAQRDIRREFSYGLAFDEAHRLAEENSDAFDQEFKQILVYVDKLLRSWLDKPGVINRTKLLSALYYDFNERYSVDRASLETHSFREHYALFRKEINPVLEKCNYALLSSKSLLDVLLAFSSYVHINA